MNDKSIIGAVVILLVAVGGFLYATSTPTVSQPATSMTSDSSSTPDLSQVNTKTPEAQLAMCMKDHGVKFFGAFWCPHCKKQKEEFKDAVPLLPYVECSEANGNDQTPVCVENKIKSYPTWQFGDGTRLEGEQTLIALAEKSGCAYPGAKAVPPALATTTLPVQPL